MRLTTEKYMHIKLISETFKGDDSKIEREIIKTLGLDPDRPKAENDKILKEIDDMLDTTPPLVSRFEFDGKEWGFIPNLQKISTNEFIDLEQYIKDGKQLHRIASILYRPIVKQNMIKDAINTIFFDKELYQIEKYDGTKYAETLKHIDFRIVLGAMFFFFEFRKGVIGRCKYLYPERDEEEKEDSLQIISDEAIFQEEFSWYSMLYQAAHEDYLKIEKVGESPAIEFLAFMNFFVRKSQLDLARIKRGS